MSGKSKKKSKQKFIDVENNSSLGERLRVVVDSFGGPSAFAEKTNISKNTLFPYLSNKSEPKASAMRAFSSVGVSIDWLLTGEGNMLLSDNASKKSSGMDDDFVLLPRYDVEAAAGAGSIIEKEKIRDYLSFKKTWLNSTGISKDNALLLRASGDSMEPTITDGSTILLDTSSKALADNGIYVFEAGGLVRIKRFRLKINGLEILSDNPIYSPELIPTADLENINIIGRVRWFGSYA